MSDGRPPASHDEPSSADETVDDAAAWFASQFADDDVAQEPPAAPVTPPTPRTETDVDAAQPTSLLPVAPRADPAPASADDEVFRPAGEDVGSAVSSAAPASSASPVSSGSAVSSADLETQALEFGGARDESVPDTSLGETAPIVPRRLPSAASFFGEPRAPRHSAKVETTEEQAGEAATASDLSSDHGAADAERAASDVPASALPSLAPHPMALDLSALRSEVHDPAPATAPDVEPDPAPATAVEPEPTVLDRERLPRHDGPGETPTAAFGAVFGDQPETESPAGSSESTAGSSEAPASDERPSVGASDPHDDSPLEPEEPSRDVSFTELISVPSDASHPSAEPARFDWNDLPAPSVAAEPVVLPEPPLGAPLIDIASAPADAAAVPPSDSPPMSGVSYEDRLYEAMMADELPAADETPVADETFAADHETPTVGHEAEAPDRDAEAAADASPRTESEPEAEPAPESAFVPAESESTVDDTLDRDPSWADAPRDPIPPALTPVEHPAESRPSSDLVDDREPAATSILPVVEPTVSSLTAPPRDADPARTEAIERPEVATSRLPIQDARPDGALGDAAGAPAPASWNLASPRADVGPIDPAAAPAAWASAAPAATGADSERVPSRSGGDGPGAGGGGFASWPRERRILLIVAIGVAFVVVLLGLFFAAQAIVRGSTASAETPPATVPTTSASASTSASARPRTSPTPSAPASVAPTTASGPAAPGTRAWNVLRGGECLSSFPNAWQTTYDVLDCGTAHPAQMVATKTLDGAAGAAYPGDAALQNQIAFACSSAAVVNLNAAKAYTDVQVSGSYPTATQWSSGDRTAYCFVSRGGGQTMTTSLAAAPA